MVTELTAAQRSCSSRSAASPHANGPGVPTRTLSARTSHDVPNGVSELIHVAGITFVGTIPAEVQPKTFFAAVLTNAALEVDAAPSLVRFLASPEAAPTIVKAGLSPLSER